MYEVRDMIDKEIKLNVPTEFKSISIHDLHNRLRGVPVRIPLVTNPDWTLDELKDGLYKAFIEMQKFRVDPAYVIMGLKTIARVVQDEANHEGCGRHGGVLDHGLKTAWGRALIVDPTRTTFCGVFPEDQILTLEGHYQVVLA